MKIDTTSITFLAAAFAVPALYAIEPPADDSPPPPMIESRDAPPAPLDMPKEQARKGDAMKAADKSAFLGLNVSEVPEMLGAHLELPEGTGVLVRMVTPGAAAAVAGIQMHDIILNVGGERVASHQDLAAIIATHQPGDEIKVVLLRKGGKQTVEPVLGERPDELPLVPGFDRLREMRGLGADNLFFEDMPADQAGRIRDMIEQNLRAMGQPDGLMEDEDFQDAMRGMRQQMQQLLDNPELVPPPAGEPGGLENSPMDVGATVRLMDNKGSVEMKTVDGSKEVTVRDPDGEMLWAGPWDTDQDKAAAPEDIRERIERLDMGGLQNGGRLKLKFFQDR